MGGSRRGAVSLTGLPTHLQTIDAANIRQTTSLSQPSAACCFFGAAFHEYGVYLELYRALVLQSVNVVNRRCVNETENPLLTASELPVDPT